MKTWTSCVFVALAAWASAAPPTTDVRAGLAEVLGSAESWNPAFLQALKRDSTYDEARRAFPTLPRSAPAAVGGLQRPKIRLERHAFVDGYELKFREGKLYAATVAFRRNLDRAAFKDASLALMEAKFGRVRPARRSNDLITIVNADGLAAQRSWVVDHWEIEMEVAP
jgi:hypothetical protein